MDQTTQLEAFAGELIAAARSLTAYHRDGALEDHRGVQHARHSIMSIAARIQALVVEPSDFLNHLAGQNQLLASLRWLGEFQVLACIPLSRSVPVRAVADLAGVPAKQLSRIVRFTGTSGFLSEPTPGQIAHTTLSAAFVKDLSYFDAAMFLAQTAAPSALSMAATTRRHGDSKLALESAYTVGLCATKSFQAASAERPKLRRQLSAYLQHTAKINHDMTELLTRLDWISLGKARIVHVGAESVQLAVALAELYPALDFIVQIGAAEAQIQEVHNARITVQKRVLGSPQIVSDAAVYLLRLPPSPTITFHPLSVTIEAELRAHFHILRNTNAILVLSPQLLPEPGSLDAESEADSRMRDLCMLQLANESDMVEMDELVEVIESIGDDSGKLVVVSKLQLRKSAPAAVGVKYQLSARPIAPFHRLFPAT